MLNFSERVKDQIAWVLIVICPALFSSNMIIARSMVGVFPPIALAFVRWFLVGLLIITVLALIRRLHWRVIKSEAKHLLFLGSLGMGICAAPVYIAAEVTTATNIGLIYSAGPLLIALIAFAAFKETLNKSQTFGLFMGLLGVVVILLKADISRLASLSFNAGDLIIVVTTISFAVYSLGLKFLKTNLTQIERFGAMALGGALWHSPFVMWEISELGPWPDMTYPILGAFIVVVFFASIGAYLSYGFIVSRLGATVAGSTLYLSPIYAAVLAVVILDEQIMAYHIIGGAMIIPGVWLISKKR